MSRRSTGSQVKRQIAEAVSAWEAEDHEEALERFDRVLEANPTFPDVHNKRGLCLALLGRSEEAEAAFAEAIRLAPGYAEAHLNRGIVLQELGLHADATASFAEAERLDHHRGDPAFPSDLGNRLAVTHAQLGDLYLVADRPLMAAEHYEAALKIRPRFIDIRAKLGEALMDAGELQRARAEFETALDQNPDFVGARLRLGIVKRRLGDRDGAIEEWQLCALADRNDLRSRAYLASVGASPLGGGPAGAEPTASD